MRKYISIFTLLIICTISGYSQADKIKNSDFTHYLDCQKYNNWKSDKGDTLRIEKSYMFDAEGTLIRKLKEYPWKEPLKLTAYSYNKNKSLIEETEYKTTYLENIFDSFQRKFFYNNKGFVDSIVATSSYPIFDYLPIDEKSNTSLKNVFEFDEPTLGPIDTTLTNIMTMGDQMITGYKKVKKEVVLVKQSTYTAAVFTFQYDNKGQRIEKFMDCDESEYSGKTIFKYDEQGRLSEIFYYYQNSYKLKYGAKQDSIYKWKNLFYRYRDSTYATNQTKNKIEHETADTIIHYNALFEYNKDRTVTETVIFPDKIYKLVCQKNKKGQIVKSTYTNTRVKNEYVNGKYVPTDTKTVPDSLFNFFEKTSIYQYDKLGRIIKRTSKYIEKIETEMIQSENFCIYKYKDNRNVKLPETEFIDYIDEYDYSSAH